jgi:hypothetical protein
MKSLDVAMIAIGAALYALIGILTNMGIVSPVVGVVKFWPAVIVPGVFAVLFGPWVGGISAAIGIFISDMVQPGHGIILLSLTVGCTSNFVGFYLIGLISRKHIGWRNLIIILIVGVATLIGMIGYLFSMGVMGLDVMSLFLGVLFISIIIVVGFSVWKPEWRNYGLASVIGLLVGSAIIGFGLWGYSQLLPLPLTTGFQMNAPFYASFFWLVWTYATEIPFLVLIVPPILKVCYNAFPFLVSKSKANPEKVKKI